MMLGAAGLTVLTLLWLIVVGPVMRANQDAHLRYEANARALDLVSLGISQIQAAEVRGRSEVASAALSADQVRARVIASAQSTGLIPTQLRNETDGSVSAVFRDTDPRLLFGFLQLLSTSEGISPRVATVTRSDDGSVSANFEFVGSGS
ncbi:MAG: type II secretion system protein GspM [Pseudomonadota bacterium]